MSQRRRRIRRTATPIGPSTREKVAAVVGAAGVVGFTGLAVWALRPGGPHPNFNHPLTGGIGNRQPKATWLVVLAVLAVVGVLMWARARARDTGAGPTRRLTAAIVAAVLAVTVLAGWFMPGGLLYHYDPPQIADDVLPEEEITLPPDTTIAGPTTLGPTTVSPSTQTGATTLTTAATPTTAATTEPTATTGTGASTSSP